MPPTHPDDRFGIGSELHLGKADPYHPSMSHGVARRKAECLVDVRFGFCASTKKILGEANKSMSAGQVAIQRQCLLAVCDAFGHASRIHLDDAKNQVGPSVIRCEG